MNWGFSINLNYFIKIFLKTVIKKSQLCRLVFHNITNRSSLPEVFCKKTVIKKSQLCRLVFHNITNRSSLPEMFCKKGVLRNFTKFIRKHLCQSLFLIKLQAQACNLIKKETPALVFSCKFCEISKNNFFYRTPLVAASILSIT